MELRPYLDSLPRGGVSDFAGRLNISTVYLSQIAAGQDGRKPSASLAGNIERESAGLVTVEEMLREATFVRIPDPNWPHPAGRPVLDFAAAQAEPAKEVANG